MAFLRLYTGDDGQSHFEEMDPLLPDTARSVAQSATSITFARPPDGRFTGWDSAQVRPWRCVAVRGPQWTGTHRPDCR